MTHALPAGQGVKSQRWTPVSGEQIQLLLSHSVPAAGRLAVEQSAIAILGRAIPPWRDSGRETGLVVGYIQSGKTMSFEAVSALARDNGFQVVIVIAGTANPLLDQSTTRLRRDLHPDDPGRERRWIQFENPGNDDATVQAVRDVLDDWRDPGTPDDYKKTILVTVLKHHRRLRTLTELFELVGLVGAPVLIIDDEADQASLNNEVAQGQESTTYHCLMQLRQAIPNHTYIQYTATPQAPLLINIIDSLSPNFVELLEPGDDYVGGREFFTMGSPYVRMIPSSEVPTRANPLSVPPDTLLEALRIFMVGVTAGIRELRNTGNRSMLVHPSHRTAQHQEFYSWVRDLFDEWKRVLDLPDGEADRQELIEEFRSAHSDLAETVGGVFPPFEDLIPQFRLAFRNTRVLEVNARGGRTPEVDWRSAYGWIFVGGQAMDRGFTVEGLTVTYMPRGIGVGNADTVQQRARFFGYKRPYLGYCRVFLEQGTLSAFEEYVAHEEDIRRQLTDIKRLGMPLDAWKRAFVLDPSLQPCRHNVLEFDYMHGRFADQWYNPQIVLADDSVVASNREVVVGYLSELSFIDDEGNQDRTPIQRHHVCRDVSLREVLERLLIKYRITGTTDSQRYTGLLLQLSLAIERNANETCTVYRMSPLAARTRSVDVAGVITNLFQGEAPVNPPSLRGSVYPGDRAIRENDHVTIQVHLLTLMREKAVMTDNVPVLAVWVPGRMGTPWVAQ